LNNRKKVVNMLETRKDITFTGTSYIEKTVTGSSEKQRINIVYLSASISDDGSSVSVNKNIQNKTEYLANKKACMEDMAEFEELALSLIE
jgi:hypothetical protein